MRTRRTLIITVLLALAACAPQFDLPDAALQTPVLTAEYLVAADGRRIALRRYEADAPKAIIVAAHGFNDYSKAFAMAGPWFAARDVTIIALDQRGFGNTPTRSLWPGTDVLADDLAVLVRAVKQQQPSLPVYLMGISMGAAVATVATARHDLPIEGLVLSGPAFWGWSRMNVLYRTTLWTAAHVAPGYLLTGEGLRRWPSDNIEMLRALSRDPLMIRETRVDTIYGLVNLMDAAFAAAGDVDVPTLVLLGEKDEIVPAGPVDEVVRRLGTAPRYGRYENGWHMLLRDLQRETVFRDIAQWIDDPAAPMPSGEEVALPGEYGH